MDPGRRGAALLATSAAVVYVVDRATKVWAERSLQGRAPMKVIPGILDFRFTTNSGGAFSIGRSAPLLFVGATAIVSLLIVATAFRHRGAVTACALGAVLGGALGNLTDRALRGSGLRGEVVDFIDLHFWPVFNVADSAIVLGALVLAVVSARRDGGSQGDAG